ncbi:hypothetical protein PM004_14010 [Clostridium paraputrificum]|uniref:hypothetical protein n=1 Tax=Clostridium paraputrificum TaxID=29363 RepID=UPI00232C7E3A|nr:hypothetical protein [Clostridium paraputrificum]MDB2090459.1 hypothetical protein [Clostridium paraputrificum]MDB2097513.1 hypothetical protein [Clostridium paraputrificum]MDY4721527.1 hypothetical protein [Clostridium paraputrificum]
MINKKEWKDFKDSGLFWWINSILHTFGWAIVFEYDDNKNISNVYPARVKFRGFDKKTNTEGYIKVSNFIKENSQDLLEESKL